MNRVQIPNTRLFYSFALFTLLFFSSCCTLLNQEVTHFRIKENKEVKVLAVREAIRDEENPNYFVTDRSRDSLIIEAQKNDSTFLIHLAPRNSRMFYLNLLNLGYGFHIDRNSELSLSYPRKVFIEKVDNVYRASSFPTLKARTIQVSGTLPCIGLYSLVLPKRQRVNGSFIGVGLEVTFAYRNNRAVAFNAGMSLDFLGFMYADNTSSFLNVQHQITSSRLVLCYGLSLSRFDHREFFFSDYSTVTRTERYSVTGSGLSLSARYHVTRNLSAGISYQPSLFTLHPERTFRIQHLTCFMIRIRLFAKQAPAIGSI